MRKLLYLSKSKLGLFLLICILFALIPQSIPISVGQQIEPPRSITPDKIVLNLNYSSFIGGSDSDSGNSVAVASDDSYFVIGSTASSNFPMLSSYNDTFSGTPVGGDAFIAKFSSNNILLWSTFFGGIGFDHGKSIAVASDDSCYVTGSTNSSNFPVLNAYNETYGGNFDAFVAKFSTNGDLLWSTFLGGGKKETSNCIAVDSDDNCYITGATKSSNFPTLNAYNDTYSENNYDDAFVTKFSANGELLWSTFLGGIHGDIGYSLAIASDDSCFVTGPTSSSNFPTLNAYDDIFNNNEVFITRFSSTGSLLWSSFFGGTHHDYGYGIALASDDSIYLTGVTMSDDFPTLNAYDDTSNGVFIDIFVAKFSSSYSLLWSTYLGGSNNFFNYAAAIAVTSDDSCYVTGYTDCSDFPTWNAYDSTFDGYDDNFITKFSSSGSLLWGSFLGGNTTDKGNDLTITSDDSCLITGITDSTNFPTQNAFQDTIGGGNDVFVSKFVEDYIGPIISNLTHMPENPTTRDNITISCNVTDESDIQSVTLYSRVNAGSWETKAMTLTVSDTYQAILSMTWNDTDTIEYYIEAVDDSPNHNVAIDNNNGLFYVFTFSRTKGVTVYSFLVFVIALPVITLLIRKRRK